MKYHERKHKAIAIALLILVCITYVLLSFIQFNLSALVFVAYGIYVCLTITFIVIMVYQDIRITSVKNNDRL